MSRQYVNYISPYQSVWPEVYAEEEQKLQAIFGDAAIEIEHIGSTAIEGLASKPIIDIAVMIDTADAADGFTEALAQIGYEFEPAQHSGIPERHFYFKGNPPHFHLSIAYTDVGGFWPRQIFFRDYLRAHREACDEYAKLKVDLVAEDPSGKTYSAGKTDFVFRILRLAGWRAFEMYRRPQSITPEPVVTQVEPREDFTVAVTFDSGETGVWDMNGRLGRGVFEDVKTYEDFQAVSVSNNTIAWEKGWPIDPVYLYDRCEMAKQA